MIYVLRGHLPSEVDRMTITDYAIVKSVVDDRLDQIQRDE